MNIGGYGFKMKDLVILAYKDGHDPAAAIMVNGQIVAAVEEERFTRCKHDPGAFPKNSIDYCVSELAKINKEITHVVYARRKPIDTAIQVFRYYFTHPFQIIWNYRFVMSHLKVTVKGVKNQIIGNSQYKKIRKDFPKLPEKIYSIDHHTGHAASAYYFSGFKNALVITWDGKGEATTITVSLGLNGKLNRIYEWGIFSSLGFVYSGITELLGFTPNDGEYKVMGMAALGKPKFDLSDLFNIHSFNGKNSPINPRWVMNIDKYLHHKKIFISDSNKFDIAASFQYYLELICLRIVSYWLEKTKMDHLVIAGGVGLNVKVNQRLWEELQLRDIYIQPAAGDAGLVLGACALLQVKFSNNLVQKLDNVYLGPSYKSDLIQDELAHSNLIYTKISNPSDVAADLISKNKIVGWFQGRMEFGPRALGNRSILANPTHSKMQEIVNSKIKFREEFRPFCPSIEENTALELIEKSKISKFMTISFSAKNNVRERIPAVVHLDNSTRIQTVNQNDNFLYFQILESLEDRIGIKAVLNTSMNVRGEPMCESPKDAINFFKNTNVDALIIGSYLVLREQQAQEYKSEVTENRLKTNY